MAFDSDKSEHTMDKPVKKKRVLAKKQKGTDSSFDLLASIFERVDSLGSVSKTILYAFGKCVGEGLRDGMAKAYKPASIYLEGHARVAVEAYKIERIAKAEANAALIQSEAKEKQLKANDDMLERVKSRIVNRELFHQSNIDAIIAESIQIAKSENKKTTATPIDESFMWKFLDGAQNVSDAQLRTLWARILNTQAIDGSVKPVTLDTLRLFDQTLAAKFRHICLVASLYYYIIPAHMFNFEELTAVNLEALLDIGVLRVVGTEFWNDFGVSHVMRISYYSDRPPSQDRPRCIIYELSAVARDIAQSIYPEWFTNEFPICHTKRKEIINALGLDYCLKYIAHTIFCYALNRQAPKITLRSLHAFRTKTFQGQKCRVILLSEGLVIKIPRSLDGCLDVFHERPLIAVGDTSNIKFALPDMVAFLEFCRASRTSINPIDAFLLVGGLRHFVRNY